MTSPNIISESYKPLIIGLTGSIAMGKSTAAQMLRDMGIAVFDADAAVHILQGPKGGYPEGAAVDAIEAAFPNSCDENGVNRQKLSQYVLGNANNMQELEAIIHPMVAKMRQDFIAEHGNEKLLVFDIPLLFEKGGADNVDKVIVVSAPADIQRARALARPNMDAEKFEHIMSMQVSDIIKRDKADYIVDSGKPLDDMREQIKKIIENLSHSLA